MRKKDTLYTVNRWNKPLFMPRENLFDEGGNANDVWQKLAFNKDPLGSALTAAKGGDPTQLYKESKGGLFNMTKAANPFSKGNLTNAFKTGAQSGLVGGVANMAGNAIGNLIGGGRSSGVGNALRTVGTVANVLPEGPWKWAIQGGAGILGGVVDWFGGSAVDQEKLNAANEGTAQLRNFTSDANTFDAVKGIEAVANVQDPYSGAGSSKKNAALRNQREEVLAFAQNSLVNNINNISEDQINDALANYSAFGGPIDTMNMGAVEYGFMSDYLNTKRKQTEKKNNVTNLFAGMPKMFPDGGQISPELRKRFSYMGYPQATTLGIQDVNNIPGSFVRMPRDKSTIYGQNKLWTASNNDVDTRSDSTRRGYHEGTIPYNAGRNGAGLGPLSILEAPVTSNPDVITGAPNILPGRIGGTGKIRSFSSQKLRDRSIRAGKDPDVRIVTEKPSVSSSRVRVVEETPAAPQVPSTTTPQSEYTPPYDFNNDVQIIGSDPFVWEDQLPSNVFDVFAFGGNMQTNSSDFSTGLTHINAGGSHESSPYDGVQMGVDSQGVPNLVEEGEVVYNDYVYSNRIELDKEAKQVFHFPKKKRLTYAEAAKKLEKEIAERPNDPISQAGFKAQMEALAEQQERQKAEMEAARAREAFEALSPEEQVAVMENAAQQEQMAQEAAMQQEAMAEQQAQPSPEEQAMMQQQMMQADGSQAALGQEVPMMAEGGHLYKGGGDKKKNVGTWKDDKENHWDVFTKPGLKRYIDNIKQRLAMAPDDETKAAIRREAMNELNTLQQSYYDYVREGAADAVHGYDDNILNHQKLFDRLYGNTGFYTTDENGNVRNLIADSINLPKGAATDDKPDNWFDGYNGPRTSIRNFGSTAYGDDKYYQDLVDEFKGLGLTYAPNNNWKDDNGVLYGLSIPEEEAAKEAIANTPKAWDWNTGSWIDRTPIESAAKTPEQKAAEEAKAKEEARRILPVHTNTLFGVEDIGPLLSMGMMDAGVGKPDTSSLYSAVRGAGNVALADWMPRGDFAVYRPDDPWFYTSPIIAQTNAAIRTANNKVSPSKGAENIALNYNLTQALGNAQRQNLEHNFDKYMKVKQYNGTIYEDNQKEYGQTSRFNANARNDAARSAAQLGLTAAREAMDADAAWNQNWYGNVGALTKAIGARRKENRTRNMIADMAATGLFGSITPDTFIANGMLRYETEEERRKRLGLPAAEGGNIRRKKGKRGLTL